VDRHDDVSLVSTCGPGSPVARRGPGGRRVVRVSTPPAWPP